MKERIREVIRRQKKTHTKKAGKYRKVVENMTRKRRDRERR